MTVTAEQLAAKLAPQPASPALCSGCTSTVVCPQHTHLYPDGPPQCRAHCRVPLDPSMWTAGLHALCVDPAPLPVQGCGNTSAGRRPVTTGPTFTAPVTLGPVQHPIRTELIDIIRWASANAPRSLQRAVGPSEIGHECMRRLTYRYTGTTPVNTASDPWFSIVGIAVHDWLDTAINRWCVNVDQSPQIRYLTEQRVTFGDDQHGVSGNCDLYDTTRQTVIDHKVVGATALRKYIDQGPSTVYQTQVHIYGAGHEQAGRPVREVAIAFYPRSGYLTDLHVWSEPYDRGIAEQAIRRANTIRQLAGSLPVGLVPAAPDPALCTWCPFYRPGAAADHTGCPGPLTT